ncbi:YbbR-like domain-containing protein [Chloroflexota bacterium]
MNAIRKVLNNLGAFILALLLAFAVWIPATLQADPFTDKEFPNVPIVFLNEPEGVILFNESEVSDRASVNVRAPESLLADLRAIDFEATMDLAVAQVGVPAMVSVDVTTDSEAVRILSVDPEEQEIHLEAIVFVTLPVSIDVQGQPATGYRITSVEIMPDQVDVRGPEPTVGQVVSATGSVSVEGVREDYVEKVGVEAVDADGMPVEGLELSPSQIEVRVGVRKRLGYKPDVEVVPDLRGAPAPGYRLGSVSVDPQTVTLVGLPSVLDELPGFVETLPVSVTGATEDLSTRTTLTLPAGVVVFGSNLVVVMVEVLPIESSRALTATVEIQGVQPGWMATASPTEVDVILEGPDATISAMTSEDLQVIVNVFGLGEGVHRVEPDVLAPEGVAVVSVIPETIEVVIVLAPTPTPTGTITPTGTVEP